MYVSKSKKYGFVGLSLTLLAFLLLTLAGCDSSSDPRVYYQATGSWQGTINNEPVRGIIAPDGSYHLAIVDVNGDFIPGAGEYVGKIGSIAPDNIGNMSLTRLRPGVSSDILPSVTFILSADLLRSDQGITLTRTPEANRPAAQGDFAGHWSILTDAVTTNVVVDANGNISGGDRENCQYFGSVNLLDPAWNIFKFNISTSNYPGKSCLNATSYSGLAMKLIEGKPRPLLWFAANSGAKPFLGAWTETINVAPVAAVTILGERADQSVLVKEGAGAAVELDAQGSSDANNDQLTYAWSGTDPDNAALIISGVSTAAFVPTKVGSYSLTLTVSDGITTNSLTRQIGVKWTPLRFENCMNGTVLDTRTNLLWLKNAGCDSLNGPTPAWGVSHTLAAERVGALPHDVTGEVLVCGLSDSASGSWHLPTLNEFREIIPQGQWSEEAIFDYVGENPNAPEWPLPYYWTGELDPVGFNSWFYVNTRYDITTEDWFGPASERTSMAVWPVRTASEAEITQCLPAP